MSGHGWQQSVLKGVGTRIEFLAEIYPRVYLMLTTIFALAGYAILALFPLLALLGVAGMYHAFFNPLYTAWSPMLGWALVTVCAGLVTYRLARFRPALPAGVVHEAANEWASHVCEERDVGVIAGTVGLGFGRLITTFDGDHDGSVAVSETQLDGAKDHLVMPVSHKGLLVSPDVADQTGSFLKRGEFLRET